MTQTFKDFNPKTVIIGDQTWMAENLAIDDGGGDIHYKSDNGQYYTWDAAMRVAKSIPGWHLPSAEEWNTAAEACGATVVDNKYKDDPYMRDYDNTKKLEDSLKVLPIGNFYCGSFGNVGSYAGFWSATEDDCYHAYYRYFGTSGTMTQYTCNMDLWFSVRLIKNIQSEGHN